MGADGIRWRLEVLGAEAAKRLSWPRRLRKLAYPWPRCPSCRCRVPSEVPAGAVVAAASVPRPLPGRPTMVTIGHKIARRRRRLGLTQEGLAERAGVSVSVIRKLEQGDRDTASLLTLRKIAQALDVTTVELFNPTPQFDGGDPGEA